MVGIARCTQQDVPAHASHVSARRVHERLANGSAAEKHACASGLPGVRLLMTSSQWNTSSSTASTPKSASTRPSSRSFSSRDRILHASTRFSRMDSPRDSEHARHAMQCTFSCCQLRASTACAATVCSRVDGGMTSRGRRRQRRGVQEARRGAPECLARRKDLPPGRQLLLHAQRRVRRHGGLRGAGAGARAVGRSLARTLPLLGRLLGGLRALPPAREHGPRSLPHPRTESGCAAALQ